MENEDEEMAKSMVKFAIFGHPRCGSTFLCSLLDSHPKILCHYEVFHPKEIVTVKGFNDVAEEMSSYTPRKRDERPAEFLETLFKYDMGGEGIGFKIFVDHSREAHDLILEDRDILKILLRRNTIHAYVSMLIAEKTGAFTQMRKNGPGTQVKVPLDAGGLLNFDRIIREYFANLKRELHDTGQKYLEISYEDLIANQETLDSVFSFLGIDRGQHELAAFTRKQNKKTLEDKVENFEAVVADFMRLYSDREETIEELNFERERIIKSYEEEIKNLHGEKKSLTKRYEAEIDALNHRVGEILNSWSWRITSPLRWLSKGWLR